MNQSEIISIIISLALSMFISLFIFDGIKNGLENLYKAITKIVISNLDLPPEISQKRILRFFYFFIAFSVFALLTKASFKILPESLAILIALFSPPIICLLFFITLFVLIELYGFLKDLLLFIFYIPYKIFKNRENVHYEYGNILDLYFKIIITIVFLCWLLFK